MVFRSQPLMWASLIDVSFRRSESTCAIHMVASICRANSGRKRQSLVVSTAVLLSESKNNYNAAIKVDGDSRMSCTIDLRAKRSQPNDSSVWDRFQWLAL